MQTVSSTKLVGEGYSYLKSRGLTPTIGDTYRANERLSVCETCSDYKENNDVLQQVLCKASEDSISSKVFDENGCPLDKWVEVDKKYKRK